MKKQENMAILALNA